MNNQKWLPQQDNRQYLTEFRILESAPRQTPVTQSTPLSRSIFHYNFDSLPYQGYYVS